MRILIIANSEVGLYKFRKELIEDIAKKHEIFIAVPNGIYTKEFEAMGCYNIPLDFKRRSINFFSEVHLIFKMLNVISTVNPDVTLSYTVKPNIYGGIICRMKKIPYVANITGLGTAVENGGVLQKIILLLYKVSLKKAERVFFQNSGNMDFFLNHNIATGINELIPGSGVNLAEYSYEEYPNNGIYEDKFLFIGRIMQAKGIEEYLEVAKRIRTEKAGISFEVIGGLEDDYNNKLLEMEKSNIIKYWGEQKDVRPFIKKCNAIVLPSYHEGMANVLLEASSKGRPVIASNIPGCKETFIEGITGFGCKPKDSESLYDAIMRFVELSQEDKARMGKAAREKVESEFDRKIVIDAYKRVIERIEA